MGSILSPLALLLYLKTIDEIRSHPAPHCRCLARFNRTGARRLCHQSRHTASAKTCAQRASRTANAYTTQHADATRSRG